MVDGQPTRRLFLTATGAALAWACAPARDSSRAAHAQPDALSRLERRLGGRIGVLALETGSGAALFHREDERFAMCSTFKWLLAATILSKVDHGELALDEAVPFGQADLLDYAPVTREHVRSGAMTIRELARAAIRVSDNTAANLLLARVGGPGGLTRFVRDLGDPVTRLDRNEPTLNTNLPGDVRDTTSPRAMVDTMQKILLGTVLSHASRDRLIGWLRECETGRKRLRAGLPAGWKAGDKTGTGRRGAANDLAILWPPGRSPILVASYMSGSRAALSVLDEGHAEIARIVSRRFASDAGLPTGQARDLAQHAR